jgi:hypothetical protein
MWDARFKRKNLGLWITFLSAFVFWSVPIQSIGVTGSLILIITIISLPFIGINREFKVNAILGVASAFWLLLILKWGSWAFYISPFYFITSLFLVSSLGKWELVKITQLATCLAFSLIVGAYAANLYYWIGLSPIFQLSTLEESLYLYLSTLSYEYAGYIRPSGIYDEPGALSFVICIIAYLRHRLGLNHLTTLVLIFTGAVTTSLAHIFFLFLFLILVKRPTRGSKGKSRAGAILLMISIGIILQIAFPENLFSSRLRVQEDGSLSGDNRTQLLISAYRIIENDFSIFMYGIGSLTEDENNALVAEYGEFTTNPLSPIIRSGVLGSFWYYAFILYYLVNGFSRPERSIMLALCFILLQRPYVMNYGYSTMLFLVIAADLKSVDLLGSRFLFPSRRPRRDTEMLSVERSDSPKGPHDPIDRG